MSGQAGDDLFQRLEGVLAGPPGGCEGDWNEKSSIADALVAQYPCIARYLRPLIEYLFRPPSAARSHPGAAAEHGRVAQGQSLGAAVAGETAYWLNEIVRKIPVPIFAIDADHRVTLWNKACEDMTGIKAADIVGTQRAWTAFYRNERPVLADLMLDAAAQEAFAAYYSGSDHPSSSLPGAREAMGRFDDFGSGPRWLALTAVPIEGPDGRVAGAIETLLDVTPQKLVEEELWHQRWHDDLTGLPNRALLLDRLNGLLPSAARDGRQVGLLFIDLDGFKVINETLGHDVGDDLLKDAARRLQAVLRDCDTLARLGGDEFAVIVPNLTDVALARTVAERISRLLTVPFPLKGQDACISASIGIAYFPGDAEDPLDLLKNAEAAMYKAKDQGKAGFQVFTPNLNLELKEHQALKNRLSKALERQEFAVFYQPKFDLATGRLDGVEALLRWSDGVLGPVSPVKFIPILEETGLIVPVGEWVIEAACRQQRQWRDQGYAPVRVAVNLSVRQLHRQDLADRVESILVATGVDPSGLELEMTESMIMGDSGSARVVLGNLHDMGIHLAMDDFGTGYSSLSYLKRFPIDTIKIDRSFIEDLTVDPDDAEIVRTIISMGHSLRRHIVAEGVETEAQRTMLRELHCDAFQGYLVSPPVAAASMAAFLSVAASPVCEGGR